MGTDEERLCEECCGVMVYYKTIGNYDMFQCLSCKHIEHEEKKRPVRNTEPSFLDEWNKSEE